MSKGKVIKSMFTFIKEKKHYWLYPIIIVFIVIGILILLGEGSAIAPFIYSLF